MKNKKTTTNTTAYASTVEYAWFGDANHNSKYKKNYTLKELKEYRKERLSGYAKNSEIVNKDYARLCKLFKGLNRNVLVETPYGEIHFIKK